MTAAPPAPDPTRPGARLVLSLVLAAMVAVAGCAPATAPTAPPPPTPAAAAPAAHPAAAEPPVAEQESTLLHDAEQELLRRCMTDAGFAYRPVARNPLPELREFPYVVDDPQWAARHGYGSELQRQAQQLRAQDPNRRYFQELSEDRRQAAVAALNGTPDRGEQFSVRLPGGATMGHSAAGCRARAWRELYGDARAWFESDTLLANLSAGIQQRVTADARYAPAVESWSACMRAHGFDHRDPASARRAATATVGGRAPDRALEVRTAGQEARCALDSGLADVVRELAQQHGDLVRGGHRAAADTAARLRAAAVPRARALLAR